MRDDVLCMVIRDVSSLLQQKRSLVSDDDDDDDDDQRLTIRISLRSQIQQLASKIEKCRKS